ncbi:MAG: cytochrome c peroxidase [Methylovulum sp.]|nr:cytochrome c peroxidase [Methylovulum sp.]
MKTGHGLNTVSASGIRGLVAPGTLFLLATLLAGEVAAHGNTPPSLQGVDVPATPGLFDGDNPIIIDKAAATQLGKALFWDVNVGSDGMACASCHFHAGADGRVKNQLSPGQFHKRAPTTLTFEATASGGSGGPNYKLRRSDFPLYRLANPNNKDSAVLFNTDDIVSSAGVFLAQFNSLGELDGERDNCTPETDAIFHLDNLNTRQVQSRQAPSVINAGYNFRNFWDGRANNIFNGVSVYGVRDPNAGIWVVGPDNTVSKQALRLENASLASQAVAPPVNASEMSCQQRGLPDIARKLLTRRPLASQEIHPEDSVLAELRDVSGQGLNTTYETLIKAAFAPRYWSGIGQFGQPAGAGATPYTQIEANFSLFFGLALQTYQQTLVSDQTPFDTPRLAGFPQMPEGLDRRQQRGLKVFLNSHCSECHKGPTLSSAAHPDIYTLSDAFSSLRLVNRKTINGAFSGNGVAQGMIDEGYFNTSVTPANSDPGVGGVDPFGHPLSFSEQYLQQLLTGAAMIDPVVVNSCDLDNAFAQDYLSSELIPDPRIVGSCGDRAVYAKIPKIAVLKAELEKKNDGRALVAVNGAFKVPSLRNIELTGPYMHNGSLLTLEQVVDFYFRGGNFNNAHHFATLVFPQTISAHEKADLVAFLKSLTDERVRWERAPFDHPQLSVPNGHKPAADPQNPEQAQDVYLNIPAVGQQGRDAALGPLKPFQQYLRP